MSFTHTCRREENQQWYQMGGGSYCRFNDNGRYCAKITKLCIELWDVQAFHLPMSVLQFPSSITDINCYAVSWSHDSSQVIGVFGGKISKKVLSRDLHVLVWNVATSQLIHQYRIPFGVNTICSLPFENGSYCLLNTLEVECFLLLDLEQGIINEILSSATIPQIACKLSRIVDSSFVNSHSTVGEVLRDADECDVQWTSRLESDGNSNHNSSPMSVYANSDGSVVLYGIAEYQLFRASLSFDSTTGLKATLIDSIDLTGFTDSVSTLVVNSDGSKLLLASSNCSAIQLYSSSSLELLSTVLKAGDTITTITGEIVPSIMNKCIGAGFVFCSWSSAVCPMEESIAIGVQTAGSSVPNKILLCKLSTSSANNNTSEGVEVLYRSISLPKCGLTEIFIGPHKYHSNSMKGGLTMFDTSNFYGVDYSGRLHLLRWSVASDFPGPMYPIGYQLIQQCSSYIEREDELDRVIVNNNSSSSGSDSDMNKDESSSEEPAAKKTKLVTHIDIGSHFDRSNQVTCKLPFNVVQHFMHREETPKIRPLHYSRRKRITELTSSESTLMPTAEDDSSNVVMELLGDAYQSGGEDSDDDNVNEDNGYNIDTFLSEGLGIPQKIITGDFFAKQKRERDVGQITLSLCDDKVHVNKILTNMKNDAIERALVQEEAKEKARIKSKEKAEERKIVAEQRKIQEEQLRRLRVAEMKNGILPPAIMAVYNQHKSAPMMPPVAVAAAAPVVREIVSETMEKNVESSGDVEEVTATEVNEVYDVVERADINNNDSSSGGDEVVVESAVVVE